MHVSHCLTPGIYYIEQADLTLRHLPSASEGLELKVCVTMCDLIFALLIISVYKSVIFVCVSAGVDVYMRTSKDNFPKSSPSAVDSRDLILVLRLVLQVILPTKPSLCLSYNLKICVLLGAMVFDGSLRV